MIWWLIAYVVLGLTILVVANFREFRKYGIGFPPLEGWVIFVGYIVIWPVVLLSTLIDYLKSYCEKKFQ